MSRPAITMNHRLLFRPKLKELPQQCAGCPFRVGNDAEFLVIIQRLRKLHGMLTLKGKAIKPGITFARTIARMDIAKGGDFACHGTSYDKDMNLKPKSDWRQCPGATEAYREACPTCPTP